MANCIICGAELVDGKCPNEELHFKKMCLNCQYYSDGVCNNEKNMESVRNKVIKSIQMPGGYELEELKIKPVQLKDPTKKCGNYSVYQQLVVNHILGLTE